MALFKNKYRIESTRLKNFDYASNATYFITICTKDKEHFFGKIDNDVMIINDIGLVVKNEWLQTPAIRPDMNLSLDEFVVMPNHFHAIISIGENEFNTRREWMHHVSDTTGKYPRPDNKNTFGTQSKNLASIVRWFKSAVTIQAKKVLPYFAWQDSYHDHIIRNGEEYLRIQYYK